jgi:hypothetical protein
MGYHTYQTSLCKSLQGNEGGPPNLDATSGVCCACCLQNRCLHEQRRPVRPGMLAM